MASGSRRLRRQDDGGARAGERTAVRRAAFRAAVGAAFLLSAAAACDAVARSGDPDWPCPQRLVPTLSAAAYWSGPPIEGSGDWRSESQVAELVGRVTPRQVAEAEGRAAIGRFIETLDAEARRRLLPLVFLGLLEETNRQRDALIEHIKRFARRQRDLADLAIRLNAELRTIPTDAAGEAAERRQDLEQRRFFVTKAFEDAERTLRYMCEAPVQLEARLGAYARLLQAALPSAP